VTVQLDDPIRTVAGGATAKAFEDGLGLHTVGDLLRHFPRRNAVRGELTDLAALREGEDVTVLAEVASTRSFRMRNRPGWRVEAVVTDGRDRLVLTFFAKSEGQAKWREGQLRAGREGLFAGKVSVYNRQRQLTHPDYLLVGADDDGDGDDSAADAAAAFANRLIPVYPATRALPSWKVAKTVGVVLDTMGDLPDPVPADVLGRMGHPSLAEAFLLIHRPTQEGDRERALDRFVFEEAYVLQVELARRRARAATLSAVPRRPRAGGVLEAFDARLPFELTAGQREVAAHLAEDLSHDHPMHRLLQGEVGSGKTVVALRAMLAVVDSGGQAALLAPTEVLAQQHDRSLRALLGPLAEHGMLGGAEVGTRVALLTGSQSTAARRSALLEAVSGDAGIVVGTHALLEESVEFRDLGLVVVDEQHRFGVEQRAALSAKGTTPPHVLVMTATPIPRTIAMTVFGDLDVSTLTEMPAGRQPVATHVVPAGEKPHYLERAWARVREEVAAGHQVYVVCPRIGGDDPDAGTDGFEAAVDLPPPDPDDDWALWEDVADATAPPAPTRQMVAVLDLAPTLADGPLAGLRLEVLHGRMPADAKDDVMRRFAAGDVDVLVATTVVEVGVDVANATGMVVMDADRFGVSQLHQLRGRVGRGSAAGLCLLVTDVEPGTPGRARLDAVAATTDGFELARVDLESRREGDVLGATQSGRRSSLRRLRVLQHEDVIQRARTEATSLVEQEPELTGHPALAAAIAVYADDEQSEYLDKT
jgi:ATP-dependent DNA helicase RecG